LYENDTKHKHEEPMEYILKDMGIQPPKKFKETDIEDSMIKEENEELKHQVRQLQD